MKCHHCGKHATHVRIKETRGGAGTVIEKTHTCKTHAGLGHSTYVNVGLIRHLEYGGYNDCY
jgi:hypothetical protein